MNHLNKLTTLCLITLSLALTACGGSKDDAKKDDKSSSATQLPDNLFVTKAPSKITPVIDAKNFSREGEEITLRVIVGGKKDPFVKNNAVMTVVDAALPNKCMEHVGDGCDTPWDYCCAASEVLNKNIATIQFNDENGNPKKLNLADSNKFKAGSTLTVTGKVGKKEGIDTLTLIASAVYVEPDKK